MNILLFALSVLWHQYHFSQTDMVFKEKEKTLQITAHIFIDDLELALEKRGQTKLFVGTERETKQANDLIFNYLKEKLKININKKKQNIVWIGKETANDKQAIWVYLEVQNVKSITDFGVENTILTELFADQKNIVRLTVPNQKLGYFTLDRQQTSGSLQFKKP